MGGQEQLTKSRVVKVDSEESWDFYRTQANGQGCPVVVHFTASWCVPSVAMNKHFEELALSYQDILFLLVDVDDVKVTFFNPSNCNNHLVLAPHELSNSGESG
eukprot:TRINITY_DN16386_c0_g1_i2.p1 TRINITY_DN16386_c0_g1~~TRINITY_DN16386_c0_g1_i2.p1  ORF type:complete len:103 (+),score=21.66 TRINITY_DN16386_c0_g1_i2:87-395(+)